MSKSAQYNEALSRPLPQLRCRYCRCAITSFCPADQGSVSWWKHVVSGRIVCNADGAVHIANPRKTHALSV